MHIETVKYVDFNGDTRQTDIYFHMPFIDLMKKDKDSDGSYLKQMLAATTNTRIANDLYGLTGLYTRLICETYGTVIHNGGRFTRPANAKIELAQLPELDQLIEDLVVDKTRGDAFIIGVLS